MRLILGSGSPRRLDLLGQLGLEPSEIRVPDIDETPGPSERPRAYCARIAREKADALPAGPDEIVLCADTTVALGRRIMGKPETPEIAATYLRRLSGRRHRVITSVAVRTIARVWTRDVVSSVRVKRLSDREIAGYIATGDWQGKAGGYGIQGPAAAFVPWIEGSHTAIVGLPLAETSQLLSAAGLLPTRMS